VTADHRPGTGQHWVFGYGSLIWRIDFPYHERRRAVIHGWGRRFWQGSHDHRGTPASPGRVVTLVPLTGSVCVGVAYRVDETVFDHLDHREKNGYERVAVDIHLDASTGLAPVPGVSYIASKSNHAFLGPAGPDEIAAHIAEARGPSGSNVDYLLELAAALDELDAGDRHVAGLAARMHVQRKGPSPAGS